MSDERLKNGDRVRVRLHDCGQWTTAAVALASDTNPSSVALLLDGVVRTGSGGMIANMLPLTIDYEKQTVASLFGDTYEIEVEGRPTAGK